MAVNQKLLEILVCPKCKGDLVFPEAGDGLICNVCRLKYEIKDDIPIMLIDEAIPLDRGEETPKSKGDEASAGTDDSGLNILPHSGIVHQVFEAWLREHPEHSFWMHRKFKRKSGQRKRKEAPAAVPARRMQYDV